LKKLIVEDIIYDQESIPFRTTYSRMLHFGNLIPKILFWKYSKNFLSKFSENF